MVPALLCLRNFLAYREACPPIDFTGIHVACLTGENGNGKSALLDAMTWALWGEARARSDDELIHLGRTEMEVEFEFYAGPQRYRVIRKRKKGTGRSPGSTSLEFHLESPGGWKALTANHVKETEGRIRDVVKLDYETFTNSAFLMQGRADAFTLRTPGERKRILAEILGLSQYDQLEQQARYEQKLRDDQTRALGHEIAALDAILANESALAEERDAIATELETIAADRAGATERVALLREAVQRQVALAQAAEQAEALRRDAAREVQQAATLIASHQQAITAYEAVTAEAGAIREGYASLQEARAEEQRLGQVVATLHGLERQREQLAGAIDRARQRLLSDARLLQAEIDGLAQKSAARATLGAEHERLEPLRRALEADELRVATMREEEQAHREVIGSLRSENVRLRDEMSGIKEKQTELASATVCPLCRTDLGAEGQAHILAAYEEQGRDLAGAYRQNQARMKEREANATGLHTDAERLAADIRRRRSELDREGGTLGHRLDEAVAAESRLPERRARLEAVQTQLDRGEFAAQETLALTAVVARIDALAYDPAAQQQASQAVREWAAFEQRYQELTRAEARLEGERTALERAEAGATNWRERLAAHTSEAARLQSALVEQSDHRGKLDEAQARLAALEARERELRQAIGAVEQQLEDCHRRRLERDHKVVALKQAQREQHIYGELTLAFSKRGIQALIIDQVLPELTDEANRLLGRMTNNRLQVMMNTQRQAQKGTLIETLDIRISDELGTRNYELFSGGEAFRINLALRISLSKLLARRSGAPLPTLVIDEGFGSQDAAARERLIEAINVVQDDFECLLIITHLDDLKDQFPARIEVQKTAEGSIATVIA